MANARENTITSSKSCISCSKIYKTSLVTNLDNCKHDICKVCLFDDDTKSENKTCPSCQSPITERQLEVMLKCIYDTSLNLQDACYEKIYRSSGGILIRKIDGVFHYLAVLQKRFNSEMKWVSPKGRLEGIETSLEAAIREISEEVGLTSISLIDFVCKQCFSYTETDKLYKKTVFWYLFNVDEPSELKLNEEEGFIESKWLTYEECLNTFSYETFIEMIKMANLILK